MADINLQARKTELMRAIDKLKPELTKMSDYIFDHPEVGYREVEASRLLAGFLRSNGFEVSPGYGGLATAFRAVCQNGSGGPCIGLLCEYDAVLNLGHVCAHHLQGPSIAGAAVALKDIMRDFPYTLEVIGTPAEETAEGGKNVMLANGAFTQLDIALMMHGGDATQTDVKSMALSEFVVTFNGISSHSAVAPDKGRSALEALMLAFNGIAYLRGHVRDDVRIHGIIENGGQAVNAIPEAAAARIEVRSYDRPYLDEVIARVLRILEGAALMTDTNYEVKRVADMHNKIPVRSLNRLLMENAETAGAKAIAPPREKTGSTDFASVMYHVPGSCIRVPFIEKGTTAHSRAWLDRGKAPEAYEAIILGAKILALTAADLIQDGNLLAGIIDEFHREKAAICSQIS
ncbi:MAG TPA: M20 family metallopeptidase [Selenomonadales bacterium]|nr:M20 family metallopeptidase [Selenomonadales bacterium]